MEKLISSFEEACEAWGISPDVLPVVDHLPEELRVTVVNYYKCCIIVKAINGGEYCDITDHDTARYEPWVSVVKDESYPSGFGFSRSSCDVAYSGAGAGSRLCFKDSKRALHFVNTFPEYKLFLV